MKNRSFLLLVILIFLFSCSGSKENTIADQAGLEKSASFERPQINLLADLPESQQPKTIILAQRPRPLKLAVPVKKEDAYTRVSPAGETINMASPVKKMLPTLKDEARRTVLDEWGQPFILGNGGISNFTTYTHDDGLGFGNVICSYLDQSGNLWFSTWGSGVSRYDGHSFTTYITARRLAGTRVNCMAQDQAGQLWFGTSDGGVIRYDPIREGGTGSSFTTITATQGLVSDTIRSILEDQAGQLWIGTNRGVSRYDPVREDGTGGRFTTYTTAQGLAGNEVRSIAEDQAGHLWFGTGGSGVSRYDPDANNGQGSFTTYTTADGLAGNDVTCITEDQAGHLWFGTDGSGVSRYDPVGEDGTGGTFTTYTTAHGLAGNEVRSIAEGKAGHLWMGTDGGGVSHYNPEANNGQGSFTTYTMAQGLVGNNVTSITKDQAGHLWFVNGNGGVSRYDDPSFTTFTSAHGLAGNRVTCILEDQAGHLWFGTWDDGVSRYDPVREDGTGGTYTTYTPAQGLADYTVLSMAEDQAGHLWMGTFAGVSRYDPAREDGTGGSFTTYTTAQGLAGNQVWSIAEDQAGHLWFGTGGSGVSRYDPIREDGTGGTFTTYTTAHGLAGNDVTCIVEDQARHLWFGTRGRGVSRYDPVREDGTGGSFTTYTTAQGLAGNDVRSIVEDQAGHLWFGSYSGVSRYDPVHEDGTGTGGSFTVFTTANGLADNNVPQILQLPNGKMAIGTYLGITLFDPPQGTTGEPTTLSGVEVYNRQTGYPVKDVGWTQHAMYLDSKGILWIGTSNNQTGLVRFDYQALRKNATPPGITIRQIKINQETINWHDFRGVDTTTYLAESSHLSDVERRVRQQKFAHLKFDSITPFYPVPQGLVLPYPYNSLTIHYGSSELARPYLVEYQYKMEGYDKDWSPVHKTTSATFGNMSEGSYTFQVKARYTGPSLKGADEWTEPISYTFRVLAPWYRSWWAYSIYVLLAASSIWGFLHWRTASLRNRQKILEHTIEERTAEVVAKNKMILKEKERSEELLLNILPAEVAKELMETGKAQPVRFEEVSILFADFKEFTNIVASIPPKNLIKELNDIFWHFDDIIMEEGLEKIKTIGDAYLAAGGLPKEDPDHAIKCVRAAKRMIEFLRERNLHTGVKWKIRIGIHSGPITAGVIGKRKFAYDLFGDTINIASRIETASDEGRINVSAFTFDLIKATFPCEYRGKISAKGKGDLDMYFVI